MLVLKYSHTVMKKNEKGFSVVEALLILVIVGLISFVGWYVWKSKNKASTHLINTQTSIESPSPSTTQEPKLPNGFVAFSNSDTGISFAYPKTWGDVKIGPSPESAHLVAGSEYQIDFTLNKSVTAGVVSTDRKHDPNAGHDGIVYAGSFVNLNVDEFVSYGTSVINQRDSSGFILSTPLQSVVCVGVGRVMVHALSTNAKYQKIAFLYFDKKADLNNGNETMCDKDQYKSNLSDEHLNELKEVYKTIK
jgi:hypothetical protein